jgi:hypothetical protein
MKHNTYDEVSLAQLVDMRDSYIKLLQEWPGSVWTASEILTINRVLDRRINDEGETFE